MRCVSLGWRRGDGQCLAGSGAGIRHPTDHWHTTVLAEGVIPEEPGIYEWRIEGVGTYIGKYGRIRRPTKEYGRNVARLLSGRPYRTGKPDGYRAIHYALAEAVRVGRPIILTILENVAPDRINQREQELIRERGATLNGPASMFKAVV